MSSMIELIILAGVALFLVLRLRSILGTRTGFEPDPQNMPAPPAPARRENFDVIEGGASDRDIADHVDLASDAGQALSKMKQAEPSFVVTEFLSGARAAYEMILMAFEEGDLETLKNFLADDVYQGFASVVNSRAEQGLSVEARFIGIRELVLTDASFDPVTSDGDITIRFVGEMTSAVRNAEGTVVEGDLNSVKRQRDIWTFSRKMGSDNPNWQLVATAQ